MEPRPAGGVRNQRPKLGRGRVPVDGGGCCRLADGESLLDDSGQAAVLLEEFSNIQAAQKQKQAELKGMRAQVESLLQSSEAMRALAGTPPAGAAPPLAELSSLLVEDEASSSALTARLASGRKPSSSSMSAAPTDAADGVPASTGGPSQPTHGGDRSSRCSSIGSEVDMPTMAPAGPHAAPRVPGADIAFAGAHDQPVRSHAWPLPDIALRPGGTGL